MMIGVAQVIGMKPTLRSFFSGAPAPCANTSVAVLSGKNCASAASAVEAPTDFRKARRTASFGKIARMTADGDDVLVTLSSLSVDGGALGPVRRRPIVLAAGSHGGRRGSLPFRRRRFGSNGLSNIPMSHGLSSRAAAAPPSILAASCRQPPVPACAPAPGLRRCRFRPRRWARLTSCMGGPVSIGSDGSRDHSFQEPK